MWLSAMPSRVGGDDYGDKLYLALPDGGCLCPETMYERDFFFDALGMKA